MVKTKLLPYSGFVALRQLNPIDKKGPKHLVFLPRNLNVLHLVYVTSEWGLKFSVVSNLDSIYEFLCGIILPFKHSGRGLQEKCFLRRRGCLKRGEGAFTEDLRPPYALLPTF